MSSVQLSREQALVATLDAMSTTAAPVVVFENSTPAGWNAVIVAMGAVFFYKDANEKPIGDEQQQRPGPLYAGQSSYVQGTRKDCCGRVIAAVTVTVDGKPKNLTGEVPDTPKECFLRTTFRVGPKAALPNDAKRGDGPYLELRRVE